MIPTVVKPHVSGAYAGYSRKLDKSCYLDFDRVFTVSGEVKESFEKIYPECADRTFIFHNLIDRMQQGMTVAKQLT